MPPRKSTRSSAAPPRSVVVPSTPLPVPLQRKSSGILTPMATNGSPSQSPKSTELIAPNNDESELSDASYGSDSGKGRSGSAKTRVSVEIPVVMTNGKGKATGKGKMVVQGTDGEDEYGDEAMSADRPMVSTSTNGVAVGRGTKRKLPSVPDSEDELGLLSTPIVKPIKKARLDTATTSTRPSLRARRSTATNSKYIDSDSDLHLGDDKEFEDDEANDDDDEEEQEHRFEEFEGDNTDLDSDSASENDSKSNKDNGKGKGKMSSKLKDGKIASHEHSHLVNKRKPNIGKGKGKDVVKPPLVKAKTQAKGKGKGKEAIKVKMEEEDAIDVDREVLELDDGSDVEGEMMKAAIQASIKEAGKSKKTATRSKVSSRRAKKLVEFSSDEDEDDFIPLTESEEDEDTKDFSTKDIKPSFSSSSKVKADPEQVAADYLAEAKAQRLSTKERLARLKQAQGQLIRQLGRKLTQGEKNGVALSLHHTDLTDVWGDLEAKIEVVKPVPMEAHPSLKLTLLPFQKESLYWMKKQEEGVWKGGMLADEMGMGKTIQTIALLLSEPRRKPSLVCAPVVALMQWKHEIETHAEGFTVCVWHGSGRMKAQDLQKYDVVLVSYGTLEASFRKQQKGFKRGNVMIKEKSPMHAFKWFRVVLDEAHNIKERSTNVSKAAFALDAEYRWCLSGTPLQNRVGELYSLVRFLGGDPFAYYYCKQCDCKSLHWDFPDRRHCSKCRHSPMQHLCFWNNEILTPIQKFGMSGPGQWAFKKLKILLDRMMLRRTKLERADDLGLPPRTITIRRDYFSPEEKELYLSLFSETKRTFSTYVSDGTVLNNYSNIFSLITRMRQMACHPDLVLRSKTAKYIENASEEIVCRICNDSAEDAITSKCNHIFDRECIRQYLEMSDASTTPECPVCHIGISIDLDGPAIEIGEEKKVKRQGILGRLDIDNWRSSTKVEALVEDLTNTKARDDTVKSLVFSQFVSFLDLIAFRLQRAGFNICRLEGGMSPQARDATIQHYMNNSSVSVMLISLRAGGVALNLTEASRVYMMDSWWNPSVELQAFDRVHRFGQRRPTEVIKFVVEDSIEAKIVQLQEKKLAMTAAALDNDPDAALGKLTPEDLSFLFKL